MDNDAGFQIALDSYSRSSPPFLQHQFFPGNRICEPVNGGKQTLLPSRRRTAEASCSVPNQGLQEHGRSNGHRKDWDVKTWDWDSDLFLAQPTANGFAASDRNKSHSGSENENSLRSHQIVLTLDSGSNSPEQTTNGSSDHEDTYYSGQRRKSRGGQNNNHPSLSEATKCFLRDGSSPEEDAESLSLKLGGHAYAYSEKNGGGSQSYKRYRSSSPGPQFPMCQVDDCKADLSHAKDYHRRHKVCEMHSKAAKALVSRLMQRFCQQCSRFHPLTEFDEGKRSCRRRLAGHNRRRRKTQPDSATARAYLGCEDDSAGRSSGLMSVLNVLAQLQSKFSLNCSIKRNLGSQIYELGLPDDVVNSIGGTNGVMNDRGALLQYLQNGSNAAAVGLENLSAAALANLLNLNGVGLRDGRFDLKQQTSTSNGHGQVSVAETEALISALAGAKSAEALSIMLQSSLRGQLSSAIAKAPEPFISHLRQSADLSPGALASSSPQRTDNDVQVPTSGFALSLPEVTRSLPRARQFSTSHTSNTVQHRSVENTALSVDVSPTRLTNGQVGTLPSVQKSFPQLQKVEGNRLANEEPVESTSNADIPIPSRTSSDGPNGQIMQESVRKYVGPAVHQPRVHQPAPNQTSENSQSGSDQSPSSSCADWQEHTGRISFKLFDKNPEDFPYLLRNQILEWLSHRPSDMESYIRPGCVILTIFISMPKPAWEELYKDFRSSLLKLTSCDGFWSKGRIHVQMDYRSAIILDGRVIFTKTLKPVSAPQLSSVRPLAVVAGQTTQLVLRGSNFMSSETRVFCAYQGNYTPQEVACVEPLPAQVPSGSGAFETEAQGFIFHGGCPDVVGRCFIEVERPFGCSNALPVIVADGAVCAELRSLEQEVETACAAAAVEAALKGFSPQDVFRCTNIIRADMEMQVIKFLNELGWIFQKTQMIAYGSDSLSSLVTHLNRLLIYAVERDWCAVVRKLLDILFGLDFGSLDKIPPELVAMFKVEVRLLHRAVRRNCQSMVQLLLEYIPISGLDMVGFDQCLRAKGALNGSIFTPDVPGPEGFTPLHIAASMEGADGVIDALTNDPNEIGLRAWISAVTVTGESPFKCALARGNASYIQLIRSKLARSDGFLVVNVGSKAGKSGIDSKSLELPVWTKRTLLCKENTCSGIVQQQSPCRALVPSTMRGLRGSLSRPFALTLVAVAAVCVCVCLVWKDPPRTFLRNPFSWRCMRSGSS